MDKNTPLKQIKKQLETTGINIEKIEILEHHITELKEQKKQCEIILEKIYYTLEELNTEYKKLIK